MSLFFYWSILILSYSQTKFYIFKLSWLFNFRVHVELQHLFSFVYQFLNCAILFILISKLFSFYYFFILKYLFLVSNFILKIPIPSFLLFLNFQFLFSNFRDEFKSTWILSIKSRNIPIYLYFRNISFNTHLFLKLHSVFHKISFLTIIICHLLYYCSELVSCCSQLDLLNPTSFFWHPTSGFSLYYKLFRHIIAIFFFS